MMSLLLKLVKRPLKKVPSNCFHYGHGINIKEEENNKTPTFTKEEQEKYRSYKEAQASYHKKKGVIKYWGKPKLKGMKTSIDLL